MNPKPFVVVVTINETFVMGVYGPFDEIRDAGDEANRITAMHGGKCRTDVVRLDDPSEAPQPWW